MIWRSTYHQRIAQLADYITAYISYVIAYLLSIALHRIDPSVFPPETKLRDSYIIIISILSFVFVLLYDKYNAYSYQRFTSLLKGIFNHIKGCFYWYLNQYCICIFIRL